MSFIGDWGSGLHLNKIDLSYYRTPCWKGNEWIWPFGPTSNEAERLRRHKSKWGHWDLCCDTRKVGKNIVEGWPKVEYDNFLPNSPSGINTALSCLFPSTSEVANLCLERPFPFSLSGLYLFLHTARKINLEYSAVILFYLIISTSKACELYC